MMTIILSSCFIILQCFAPTAFGIDWFPSVALPNTDYLDEDLAEPRLFFNSTGTYNATTLATWSGAALFVALNSIFVMMFLSPKAAQKEADQEYEYYDDDSFSYDEVVKKRRRYVLFAIVTCHILKSANVTQL